MYNNNKEPVMYELYVEQGIDPDDPSKTCPISRMPSGKRALFKREHWSKIRLGETWQAYVDLDAENYAMMHPVKRISSDSPGAVSLEAQDTLVSLAEEEISKIRVRMESVLEVLSPLEEQYAHLESETNALRDKMTPMERELSDLKVKLDKLESAVQSISR